MTHLPKALLLASLMAAGCGSHATGVSALASGPADLRFSGIPVEMYVPGASSTVPVLNGATFSVPCNTQGFRARYRYENAGQSGAGAHTNASAAAGSATYSFLQAPLAAGSLRYANASFGAINVANTPVKLAIHLDAPGIGVVSESDETNNTWVAKVVRHCP